MRCVLAFALSLALCVSLSGQAPPSDMSTLPPEALAQPSEMPSNPTDELANISLGLYETADDLDRLFLALSKWLKEAGLYQQSSELTLTESARLVENGTNILTDLKASQKNLERTVKAQKIELWIWRGATFAASLAAVFFYAGTR